MSVNRAWWDERAGLHGKDRVYDTAGFLAGSSRLRQLEIEVAGDVHGQDVVHLQCHTGMDTLSWLRVGAGTVTGIDFSDVAVEKARQTAAAAGYADQAWFVQADAVAVPVGLQDRFDVCVATYGVLEWIGDVPAWMRSAAGLLRRGGRLVVVDFHPLLQMAETVDPLCLCFPYANDGPHRFGDQTGSYAVPDAPTQANEVEQYAHSLGEIVTAAANAGLRVEHLGEHVDAEIDPHGVLTAGPDGRHRWQIDGELLPVLYSLRARKLPPDG